MNSTSRNRILVTGGSGFVGRHLIHKLAMLGRPVIATSTRVLPELSNEYLASWVQWDATSGTLPDIHWEAIDTIVHLAKPRNAIRPGSAAEHLALSVTATSALLRRAREFGIRRFIFASTGYALGARSASVMESDRTFEPREEYGTCKACGELITASFAKSLSTAVLRLFFPYGPRGDRYFVNRMVRAVQSGSEIRLDGPEGIRINPVWIDDVVDGLVQAIGSDACGTFHLAGPESVSLRQLCQLISAETGRRPVFRQLATEQVDWHVGDTTMAQSLLAYRPQCDLRTGLRRLAECSAEVTI